MTASHELRTPLTTIGMAVDLLVEDPEAALREPELLAAAQEETRRLKALVNDLLRVRLVSLEDNPAHRRSALVRLTPDGQDVIERMKRRERELFAGLRLETRPDDVRRAAAILSAVREAFGGKT